MAERIAFRMKLNPGQAAEYEKRHDEIWPELAAAIRASGVTDYSIWLDPETNYLFATLVQEGDGAGAPVTEINRAWWDFMADVMAVNPDNSPVQVPLKRVFHLP